MSRKVVFMMGMIAGSLAGSFVASLFGAGMLSMTSIIGSTAGGILGIWIALKNYLKLPAVSGDIVSLKSVKHQSYSLSAYQLTGGTSHEYQQIHEGTRSIRKTTAALR